MSHPTEKDLIHDWNEPYFQPSEPIQFDDETLRDGLQSPSAKSPPWTTNSSWST